MAQGYKGTIKQLFDIAGFVEGRKDDRDLGMWLTHAVYTLLVQRILAQRRKGAKKTILKLYIYMS
jgi:hypothetical protein